LIDFSAEKTSSGVPILAPDYIRRIFLPTLGFSAEKTSSGEPILAPDWI